MEIWTLFYNSKKRGKHVPNLQFLYWTVTMSSSLILNQILHPNQILIQTKPDPCPNSTEPMPPLNIKNPDFGYCKNNTCSYFPRECIWKSRKLLLNISSQHQIIYLYKVEKHCTGARKNRDMFHDSFNINVICNQWLFFVILMTFFNLFVFWINI